MRYQLNDQDRHVKTIAVEEHFSTPMQTQKSSPDAFRDFYISTRSKYIGHNIVEQLADLDEQRLAYMLGHFGECLPFAMNRMNDHTFPAAKHRGLQKTPLQYLKENMVVTTSGN
jgi:predicted TIM-barrel fold metal-dependent hydrolase